MTVWVITGCSSGIGKVISLAALKKGDIVVATCRGGFDRLSTLRDAGAIPLELDITSDWTILEDFVKDVLDLPAVKAAGGVDVLLNNAGYVLQGALEETSQEEDYASFAANLFGHANLTRAFLPHFREKRAGTIAFIGSCVGYMAYPGMWAYVSAKYAVAGLAEALALDIEPFGIKVTCIELGQFRTEVFESYKSKMAKNILPAYEETTAGAARKLYAEVSQKQDGDPLKAATKIVALLGGESILPMAKLPVRIALGDVAFADVQNWYGRRLKENEEWKDWICGTGFD